jgi:hypothetical protein
MGRVHRQVDALAREALAPVARHRIGVIQCFRLLEVEPDAPPSDLDRGQSPLMVELLDGCHGAVGDVQRPVALTKLDAVTDGETALLHALHFKGPALLGVDDTDQAAALELEPEEVPPLVETDDPRALACLDTATPSHEAQHVAHVVAFRASPLLGGEILPHDHRRLDALPLHPAGFD